MGIFGRKKQHQPPSDEVAAPVPSDEPPPRGPKDRADVEDLDGRLDLGAIWLRGVPGMQLRIETDRERQSVVGAHLVLGDSQVQVQAFAAPKSSGIWDEIRDEIAHGLSTAGGTAEEVEGPFGTELHARMPSRGPNGQSGFAPVRFVGFDGPRWFFRAAMSGPAATDDAKAEQFYALIDDMVIVRGEVPMAPRELLALTLPTRQQDAAGDEDSGDESQAKDGKGASLDPFRRGPESTETR